ncbi:hypothetical protein, partial [Hydrotalea sp. AMD]|uniref:hypothetical protein n=1 Tax=Hydrotalea sp. AMD TaxID=2501297 RepID=UPI0025800A38
MYCRQQRFGVSGAGRMNHQLFAFISSCFSTTFNIELKFLNSSSLILISFGYRLDEYKLPTERQADGR